MPTFRRFILQPTYRTESGVPVLHLYGRLEDGRSFLVRVEVREPADTPALRDRLAKAGVPTYEADVRFALRHLIDRGIRGCLEIRGAGREAPGVGLVFEDPEIVPADRGPSGYRPSSWSRARWPSCVSGPS